MLTVDISKQLPHFSLNVRFTIENEIIVLFGPSGSGKTTVLNCLAGLDHPDHGIIQMDEKVFYQDTKILLQPQVRHIGYLFQDYALFPHMNVEKNIYFGISKKSIRPDFLHNLISSLGIGHLLKKYPHQISGGEKQRVALARALATEPSLLLLDEPLSALDTQTRIQCQDEILRLHKEWEIPFIIVTHDLEEAKKLGSSILYMEQGLVTKQEHLCLNPL